MTEKKTQEGRRKREKRNCILTCIYGNVNIIKGETLAETFHIVLAKFTKTLMMKIVSLMSYWEPKKKKKLIIMFLFLQTSTQITVTFPP